MKHALFVLLAFLFVGCPNKQEPSIVPDDEAPNRIPADDEGKDEPEPPGLELPQDEAHEQEPGGLREESDPEEATGEER